MIDSSGYMGYWRLCRIIKNIFSKNMNNNKFTKSF